MVQVAILEVGVGCIVHEPNHALFDYPPFLALIVVDEEEVVLVEVELCAVVAEVQVQTVVGGYHQMPVVEVVVVVVVVDDADVDVGAGVDAGVEYREAERPNLL